MFKDNKGMNTTRQQKVARLLQKEVANILQIDGKNIYGSALVTVTEVSVSRDFSFARIYVSIFTVGDKSDVLRTIESNKREIRYKLGKQIKNQLRIVPELVFEIDDTLDYIENINNLLKK
ncbi:MAG: 30S ribosome-binding factor RbfA [Bacteroidales bacterium]|jgi:ribosome-binding factor A|nr:30S ribosome-binding factor RbfA [Bacteroidales bacterium]